MATTIRNVNKKLFADLKAEAVIEGLTVGEALTMAIYEWVEKRKTKKRKLNFLDLKPVSWGKGTEKTSKEIDNIVYGD